jgi:hypothetical protein
VDTSTAGLFEHQKKQTGPDREPSAKTSVEQMAPRANIVPLREAW